MTAKHLINSGDRFNRWVVVEPLRVSGKLYYKVICDCGNSSRVESSHLVSGKSGSCGCLHKELVALRGTKHGMCKSKTYKTWEMMIQRGREDSKSFKNYRDKGISVCDRWKEDFGNFLEDMGERPEGASLDRKDNTKGYNKENCRWANTTVQAVNKGLNSLNTSGVKGVSWDTNKERWRATLILKKRVLLDKLFINKDDAISARLAAESLYFKPILEDIS